MLQKAKKLLSRSTLRQIGWRSASKYALLAGAGIFCLVQGGVLGMAASGVAAFWTIKKGKKWEPAMTGLVFLAAFFGTSLRAPQNFWLFTLLLVGIVFTLLYKEAEIAETGKKRNMCLAGGAAFLSAQIAWILNFLPLHPVSFSAILALIYLVLRRVMEKARSGALGREGILKECLVFSVILLFVLGTTSWGL